MFKISAFLLVLLSVSASQGAIGCRDTLYTPDEWDTSTHHYQKCSCSCNTTLDAQGHCPKCGHSGRIDRGAITKKLLADLDKVSIR